MRNSRFTVAIHILTVMATIEDLSADKYPTSKGIAFSVQTNPVVIRRMIGDLRRAGLVTSQPGVKGGAQLARSADAITLCDVYRAVKKQSLLALHSSPPNQFCPVGSTIGDVLTPIFADAETALETRLAQVTIADVMRDSLAATQPDFIAALQRHLNP